MNISYLEMLFGFVSFKELVLLLVSISCVFPISDSSHALCAWCSEYSFYTLYFQTLICSVWDFPSFKAFFSSPSASLELCADTGKATAAFQIGELRLSS